MVHKIYDKDGRFLLYFDSDSDILTIPNRGKSVVVKLDDYRKQEPGRDSQSGDEGQDEESASRAA